MLEVEKQRAMGEEAVEIQAKVNVAADQMGLSAAAAMNSVGRKVRCIRSEGNVQSEKWPV